MRQFILPPQIIPYWATRFTICCEIENVCYKLFQVILPNGEPTVYVNFPYFPTSEGIAAVATLRGDGTVNQTLDLQQQGKLTSHLVKYSHHADGETHFSQDGKVKTELRKQSIPLAHLNGHMFTASFGDITSFKKLTGDAARLNTIKNGGIILRPHQDPGWLKVAGFWYRKQFAARLYQHFAVDGKIGPIIRDELGNMIAFLSAHNSGSGSLWVLALRPEPLPDFRSNDGPGQTFVGGFDTEFRVNDLSQDTSVLMFNYPASNYAALQGQMESIDFVPLPRSNDEP